MIEYWKKAIAQSNLEALLEINADIFMTKEDRDLIKAIQETQSCDAQILYQKCGINILLHYMKICCDYDKIEYNKKLMDYIGRNS